MNEPVTWDDPNDHECRNECRGHTSQLEVRMEVLREYWGMTPIVEIRWGLQGTPWNALDIFHFTQLEDFEEVPAFLVKLRANLWSMMTEHVL